MSPIYTVELAIAAVGLAVFLGRYFLYSAWRTEMGRHVAAFTSVILVLIVLRFLDVTVGPLWPWIWMAGWAALDVVCWWRVVLLNQAQRSKE